MTGNASFSVMGKKPSNTTVVQQAPIPAVAPPVSKTSADVVQATTELRQQEMLKKSVKNTVKAGDSGGWSKLPNPMKGAPGMPGAKGY